MTLKEAIAYDTAPYFTNYPFMAHDSGGLLDGNAILYAGSYGLLHHILFGGYDMAGIHSTRLYMESYVEGQKPIISRGPHKAEDPQAHDDYIGLSTLSFLGGGGVARAFFEYGSKNHWSFRRKEHNRPSEIFNGLFWRIPGVIQHIKLCAGKDLGLIDSALWALGVYSNSLARKGDVSGVILTWHMIHVYNNKNWLCNWAVRKWKHSLLEKYPGAMGDVFAVYYGHSHPFVKWAQGII